MSRARLKKGFVGKQNLRPVEVRVVPTKGEARSNLSFCQERCVAQRPVFEVEVVSDSVDGVSARPEDSREVRVGNMAIIQRRLVNKPSEERIVPDVLFPDWGKESASYQRSPFGYDRSKQLHTQTRVSFPRLTFCCHFL